MIGACFVLELAIALEYEFAACLPNPVSIRLVAFAGAADDGKTVVAGAASGARGIDDDIFLADGDDGGFERDRRGVGINKRDRRDDIDRDSQRRLRPFVVDLNKQTVVVGRR